MAAVMDVDQFNVPMDHATQVYDVPTLGMAFVVVHAHLV